MDTNTASELWDVLRSYIDSSELGAAAESLVGIMVDNNCEIADIKEAFSHDSVVKNAIKYFVTNLDSEEESYELEEDFYELEEDEDY